MAVPALRRADGRKKIHTTFPARGLSCSESGSRSRGFEIFPGPPTIVWPLRSLATQTPKTRPAGESLYPPQWLFINLKRSYCVVVAVMVPGFLSQGIASVGLISLGITHTLASGTCYGCCLRVVVVVLPWLCVAAYFFVRLPALARLRMAKDPACTVPSRVSM